MTVKEARTIVRLVIYARTYNYVDMDAEALLEGLRIEFPAFDWPMIWRHAEREELDTASDREASRDVHAWFGLTYANHLVLPRSVLQSMPEDWQHRFVGLMDEAQAAFGHLDWPEYAVRAKDKSGRYIKDPIPHYNRGRTRIQPRTSLTAATQAKLTPESR